eukprot:scaffold16937_cov66-Phaeocystis_antarctica.AAC.1
MAVATEVATAVAATAVETAAAKEVAVRAGARVVATAEVVKEAAMAGSHSTTTPAHHRARSRRGAPREAPPACTDEHRIGCTAPARPPTSRCTGSRPSPLTSCHKRRTCCHTPTPALRTGASTYAATASAAARAVATEAGTAAEATAGVERAEAAMAAAARVG